MCKSNSAKSNTRAAKSTGLFLSPDKAPKATKTAAARCASQWARLLTDMSPSESCRASSLPAHTTSTNHGIRAMPLGKTEAAQPSHETVKGVLHTCAGGTYNTIRAIRTIRRYCEYELVKMPDICFRQ